MSKIGMHWALLILFGFVVIAIPATCQQPATSETAVQQPAQPATPTSPAPSAPAAKDGQEDTDVEVGEQKYTSEQQKEIEAKACGPKGVDHWTKTDKDQHPVPAAPADQALIFVVRPTMMGNKVQSKLGVDGRWVGINRGDNYFFFTLAAGEHFLCSQSENHSVLVLKVEPGKTYYLQQKVKMGFAKARTKLVQLKKDEGEKALAKCHPSSFGEKGKGAEVAKD